MQGHEETKEEERLEIEEGEEEADIDKETADEILGEDDEITELEEGFMEGEIAAESVEDSRMVECALCHKILGENFIEQEIDGKIYRFCSQEHAEIFKKLKQERKI